MSTFPALFTNSGELHIRGTFGLTAAAAVATSPAPTGDCVPAVSSITKTGTGTYRIRITKTRMSSYRVVSVVAARVDFYGATAPAGAVATRVTSVTSEASTGDCLIDIVTANATWVPTDTTAAVVLTYDVVIKTSQRVG